MHVEGQVVRAGNPWIEARVAAGRRHVAQAPVQARPHHAHGELLQPGVVVRAADQGDFRAVFLPEPLREGLRNRGRAEVLVLEVQVPLRGGDRIEIQVLDLLDLGMAVVPGNGARDADRDVTDGRLERLRPGIAATRRRLALELLAGGAPPALARQLAEGCGRSAVHRDLCVVERRTRLAARVAPPRIVGQVFRRIPAAVGQIDPADKGDGIIDDDDFLVVRRPDRMRAVQLEVHAPVRTPAELVARQHLAIRRVRHGEIPVQNVDVQLARPLGQCVEELVERFGQAVVSALGDEAHAAVDVPAEDEYRAARCPRGCAHGREVRGAVHQEGHARRARELPAVPFRLEQSVVVRGCAHAVGR